MFCPSCGASVGTVSRLCALCEAGEFLSENPQNVKSEVIGIKNRSLFFDIRYVLPGTLLILLVISWCFLRLHLLFDIYTSTLLSIASVGSALYFILIFYRLWFTFLRISTSGSKIYDKAHALLVRSIARWSFFISLFCMGAVIYNSGFSKGLDIICSVLELERCEVELDTPIPLKSITPKPKRDANLDMGGF